MTVSVPLRFHSICYFPVYAPVGSRLPGPCAPVLISSLHMYSRSSCALPSVVLICFTFRTQYTVSYITCIVILHRSLNIDFIPPRLALSVKPQSSPSARPSSSVPLRAGLDNAGSASDIDTVRKPLVLFFLHVPPGQKHNRMGVVYGRTPQCC
jgi:hypothetical protein